MLNRGKVVLFQPPYEGKVFGPPLGLLSLASSLREAGFEPCIVDAAVTTAYEAAIESKIEGALAFGVSLLTGPMIRDAIHASLSVKRKNPRLPVIYGGWHPSLTPAQTLSEDFVDIVVVQQGERTLVEVLERLQRGVGLDLAAGCWFKRDGRLISNPDRPAAALGSLPPPAYDLVDFEAYARVAGSRRLPYAASVGCPYACNYCTDMVFYNRRFNPLSPERVVTEMVALVKRHRVDEVALVDSNFLVDVRRALAIARGIAASGCRFRWTFQASTDLLCRMSDDEVCLLAESGVSHIGFGTESASPEVLKRMNKAHQEVADMFEAARKCRLANIRTTFNLIFGYPGENESHRNQTLRVMGEIADRFDNVAFSPNLFTPYPGIPIWPELRELGMDEPRTLADWSAFGLGATELPWLDESSRRALKRGISYFVLDNRLNRIGRRARRRFASRIVRLVRKPLLWRIRHGCFRLPVELWFSKARERLAIRRSLLTGAALGNGMTGVR